MPVFKNMYVFDVFITQVVTFIKRLQKLRSSQSKLMVGKYSHIYEIKGFQEEVDIQDYLRKKKKCFENECFDAFNIKILETVSTNIKPKQEQEHKQKQGTTENCILFDRSCIFVSDFIIYVKNLNI